VSLAKDECPEEVLLSYLTGLGPVGQPLEVNRRELMRDLDIPIKTYFYRLLARLVKAGAVKRLTTGAHNRIGLIAVMKRPEQLQFPRKSLRGGRNCQEQWAPYRAKLNKQLVAKQREDNITLPGMPKWAADIIKGVALRHPNVTSLDIIGPHRHRHFVKARHEAIYLIALERATDKPWLSYPKIGSWFSRDHATIIHSIQTHCRRHGLPSITKSDRNRSTYARDRYRAAKEAARP
jgi:hypothetical protein